MSVEQANKELNKATSEASGTGSREAGRRVGQALGKYNDEVKKKQDKRFESEIHEITRYHEDRVMKNKTYH